jgi:hypothetical protein
MFRHMKDLALGGILAVQVLNEKARWLLGLAAVVVLAAAAIVGFASDARGHAPWKHDDGELESPKIHHLGWLVREVRANAEARCLPVPDEPYEAVAGNVAEWKRDDLIAEWQSKLEKVVAAESECWSAPWPEWWLAQATAVHSCEGAWNANTGNGYYGGMQMDMNFMSAYGGEFLARWGTADNWPIWAQLTAAYRGWQARGWQPWPTCAANAGLL